MIHRYLYTLNFDFCISGSGKGLLGYLCTSVKVEEKRRSQKLSGLHGIFDLHRYFSKLLIILTVKELK